MKKSFLALFLTTHLFGDASIFVYHRFNDSRHTSTSISISKLRSDFLWLKENGYEVIPLQELIKLVKEKKDLNKKVVLTIDDNYKSFYTQALEVFDEFNYPFTIFVYTKATQERYGDFMSWNELLDLKNYKAEIGFHSHAHEHLTNISNQQLSQDLKYGLELFVKNLNFYPKYFAYPYGEFDLDLKNLIKSYNFEAILNQNSGAINQNSDLFSINRFALGEDTNIKNILKIKALDAKWNEELLINKNTLITLSVELDDKTINEINLYITGYGWRFVKVKNGKIHEELNLALKNDRTRIYLRTKDSRQSSFIVVKKKG